MTRARTVSFRVAGLEAKVRFAGNPEPALADFYERYPSARRPPDLVLELERVRGLAEGQSADALYPGFHRRLVDARTIELSRIDAEGAIVLPEAPGEPVRGSFRIGEAPGTPSAVMALGASITLPRVGGLVLHASAVVTRSRATVFAGQSGAGKSTISSLLDDHQSGAEKVADEMLILAPDETGTWRVYTPPFVSDATLPHGESWPLAGLYFLVQAPGHRATELGAGEAVRELLRHVLVYVLEPETARHVLETASRLTAAVPCARLEFAKDPGVAEVLGLGSVDDGDCVRPPK